MRLVGRRLAIAALVTLWCALIAGLLGRYAWPLDLFAHFRVQYAMLFLVVAIVLFALRHPGLAALSIGGAVLAAVPIVSYMSVSTARAQTAAENFRAVAFNTWFRNHDFAAIGRFLEQAQPDVIVLEELTREQGIELGTYLPSYPHSHIPLQPRRYGAIVFARWPVIAAQSLALTDGSPTAFQEAAAKDRIEPGNAAGHALQW